MIMENSVRLISKVKADMVFLREIIAHDKDQVVIEIAKNALAKNQAWLDHWINQAEFTHRNNSK